MTSPAFQLLICCLLTCMASAILPVSVPVPVAFPGFRVKPGQCPSDVDYPICEIPNPDVKEDCVRDRDCKGKAKCCYSGCRNRCLLPLEDKTDSCPCFNAIECYTMRPSPSGCHDDNQCQGSDRCCYFNCQNQCVPTVKVKPGQCPAKPKMCPFKATVEGPELSVDNPELSVGREDLIKPPRRCNTDVDCRGARKCCESCGMRCLTPIKEHSGFCPVSNEQISCITSFERSCCTNDEDCKLNYKCCLVDNRMECVPALKVKPGTCPVVNTLVACALPIRPGDCTSDSHCPDNKKCCDVGCVRRCIGV